MATPLPNPLLDLLLDQTLDWLSPRWLQLFSGTLPPSTRRSYDSAMRRFSGFCNCYQVPTPFPVTEMLLCSFAAFLAEDGLAPPTIKLYQAAIHNTQLSLGLPDPREQSALPVLMRVLAGIGRARLQQLRIRLPITAPMLRRIKGELERTAHPESRVLWAVCCTAFFGFFLPWGDPPGITGPIQPTAPPCLGGHGSGQPPVPNNHQVPPKAIQDRPSWQRGRHCARQDKMCYLPSGCSSWLCSSTGESPGPLLFNIKGSATPQARVCGRDSEGLGGFGPS